MFWVHCHPPNCLGTSRQEECQGEGVEHSLGTLCLADVPPEAQWHRCRRKGNCSWGAVPQVTSTWHTRRAEGAGAVLGAARSDKTGLDLASACLWLQANERQRLSRTQEWAGGNIQAGLSEGRGGSQVVSGGSARLRRFVPGLDVIALP